MRIRPLLPLLLAALLLASAAVAPAQVGNGLWFANYNSSTSSAGITKYAHDGTLLKDVPLPGARLCYSAAMDYARNVWITDNQSKAYKVDSTGLILKTVNTGTSPQGVAVDANDNLFIVSRGAKTITKYDTNGTAVGSGKTPKGALSAVVDVQGNVWVPVFDLGANVPFELYQFDNTLAKMVTHTYTPNSTASFGFSGIATDVNGNIYVANQANSSVMGIDPNGKKFWETKLPTGYARGVTTDAVGHVWAAGHAGRAVFKLRSVDGKLLTTIPTVNNWPLCGVLIDANSDVWSLGNSSTTTTVPNINKWYRMDGTHLVRTSQRLGSTVATGDSSGFHSAVFLNGSKDWDGDKVSNLDEAKAGSNFLDQFSTPKTPTPIISGQLKAGQKTYIAVRHLASAGKSYAVGLSFGITPGIPTPWGTIPLNPDSLLILSQTLGAPIFNQMLGSLDPLGDGLAWVELPAGIPANITIYTAFVTYDSSVIVISNPAKMLTQ